MLRTQRVYTSFIPYTSRQQTSMRTNIVIDDKLIAEAMRLSGARTKREAVEDSLRLMVQLKRQERIRRARGKLKWTGDLEAMRRD
jgi:Arc/MetJ family transcription regulator